MNLAFSYQLINLVNKTLPTRFGQTLSGSAKKKKKKKKRATTDGKSWQWLMQNNIASPRKSTTKLPGFHLAPPKFKVGCSISWSANILLQFPSLDFAQGEFISLKKLNDMLTTPIKLKKNQFIM